METAKAEDATAYLNNAIKDHIGKLSSKWSRHDWADVDRIVKGSVYSVLKESTGPGDVKRILSSIKSGYGCWLDMWWRQGFKRPWLTFPAT